jgi:hypothetical protein
MREIVMGNFHSTIEEDVKRRKEMKRLRAFFRTNKMEANAMLVDVKGSRKILYATDRDCSIKPASKSMTEIADKRPHQQ